MRIKKRIARTISHILTRDSGGGGPPGVRAANVGWWRGHLTRRVVVVDGVSLRPAPLPPPCCAGWSPFPRLQRGRMKNGLHHDSNQTLQRRRLPRAGGISRPIRRGKARSRAPLLHAVRVLAGLPDEKLPARARVQGRSTCLPQTIRRADPTRPAVRRTAGVVAIHPGQPRRARARGARDFSQHLRRCVGRLPCGGYARRVGAAAKAQIKGKDERAMKSARSLLTRDSGGGGPPAASAASEGWWRGRRTRRFAFVERDSLRPAPLGPLCFAERSPLPASRGGMQIRDRLHALARGRRVDRERMHAAGKFAGESGVDQAVAFEPALPTESVRHDMDSEMGLTAWPMSRMTFVLVRFVVDAQAQRAESLAQLFCDPIVRLHGPNHLFPGRYAAKARSSASFAAPRRSGVMRCRPRIVANSESGTIPERRRIVSRCAASGKTQAREITPCQVLRPSPTRPHNWMQ